MKPLPKYLVRTAAIATAGLSAIAADSSADALLNMLQKKGLLTEDEVRTLRAEQQKQQAAAKAAAPAMPAWVANTKFSGDLRGRYEGLFAGDESFQDRNRFRYRLRAGLVSSVGDNFEVGFRLASGEAATGTAGGDPISGNASFQDNGSKKLLFVDLAYAKWTPVRNDEWTIATSAGKIENPFQYSDLVFDHDYTPEGIGQTFVWKTTPKHTARLNLGAFVLDGIGKLETDGFLLGAQMRVDSKWNSRWQTGAGIGALTLRGEETLVNGAVPNQNRGNSRSGANGYGAGALDEHFAALVADASVTYTLDSMPLYTGKFPIKLAGEYLSNVAAADDRNGASIGVTFGALGKKRQWEFGYKYKYLERDAWYEELVDSDFGGFYRRAADAGGAAGYGAGTNVKGHVLKAGYSLTDSCSLAATLALTDLVDESPAGSDSSFARLQCDITWKF